MVVSLKVLLQAVVFQLLKPIGGVRARPFSSALAVDGPSTITAADAAATPATVSRAVTGPRTVRDRCWYMGPSKGCEWPVCGNGRILGYAGERKPFRRRRSGPGRVRR